MEHLSSSLYLFHEVPGALDLSLHLLQGQAHLFEDVGERRAAFPSTLYEIACIRLFVSRSILGLILAVWVHSESRFVLALPDTACILGDRLQFLLLAFWRIDIGQRALVLLSAKPATLSGLDACRGHPRLLQFIIKRWLLYRTRFLR